MELRDVKAALVIRKQCKAKVSSSGGLALVVFPKPVHGTVFKAEQFAG